MCAVRSREASSFGGLGAKSVAGPIGGLLGRTRADIERDSTVECSYVSAPDRNGPQITLQTS